jgi:hypothetical protein
MKEADFASDAEQVSETKHNKVSVAMHCNLLLDIARTCSCFPFDWGFYPYPRALEVPSKRRRGDAALEVETDCHPTLQLEPFITSCP